MLHKMRPKENRRRASVPKEKICLHIYCPFCSDQCMPRGAVCTQLLGRNVNVYAHSAHASHACQNVALALSEPTEHDLTSASHLASLGHSQMHYVSLESFEPSTCRLHMRINTVTARRRRRQKNAL